MRKVPLCARSTVERFVFSRLPTSRWGRPMVDMGVSMNWPMQIWICCTMASSLRGFLDDFLLAPPHTHTHTHAQLVVLVLALT